MLESSSLVGFLKHVRICIYHKNVRAVLPLVELDFSILTNNLAGLNCPDWLRGKGTCTNFFFRLERGFISNIFFSCPEQLNR